MAFAASLTPLVSSTHVQPHPFSEHTPTTPEAPIGAQRLPIRTKKKKTPSAPLTRPPPSSYTYPKLAETHPTSSSRMPGQLPPTSQPRLERLKLNIMSNDRGGGRDAELARSHPTPHRGGPARQWPRQQQLRQ